MTKLPPEVEKLIQELGVSPGEWGASAEHFSAGVVGRQRQNLLKLRGILEKALAEDQKRLAGLREQVNRLKHGGGS